MGLGGDIKLRWVDAVQARVGDGVGVPCKEGSEVAVAQRKEVVKVAFAPAKGGEDFLLGIGGACVLGQELVFIPCKEQVSDEGCWRDAHGDTADLPDQDGAEAYESGCQEATEHDGEVSGCEAVCGVLLGMLGALSRRGSVTEMGLGMGFGMGFVWVRRGIYHGDVGGVGERHALNA